MEGRDTINLKARLGSCVLPCESLPHPYDGSKPIFAVSWLDTDNAELLDEHGVQVAPLHYPHLSHNEIFHSVEEFYRTFYFRAPKIASIVTEMALSPDMLKRRLREAVEFFGFLRERRQAAN